MHLTRRDILKQAGLVSLGFGGLQALVRTLEASPALRARPAVGFGPLLPDPEGCFNLPEGFSYRILSKAGETMDDGFLVPWLHDGMAAFPGPDGLTILVRNHEVAVEAPRMGAFGPSRELLDRVDPQLLYDRGRHGRPPLGGTTTLVYDTKARALRRHFLSLAGTSTNCAGGPTPRNTWITCEETQQRAEGECLRDHGYNFEVPASTEIGLTTPVPLKAMGRFTHEAVAVDPRTGIIYQTEDQPDGLLYRFIPDKPDVLAAGGRLQALAVQGRPGFDTRNWPDLEGSPAVDIGQVLAVSWIDLEDVESPRSDLRLRGFEAGAARFARAEGIWHGRDNVYIACTEGGLERRGQIWRYAPSPHEGAPGEAESPGRLELFVESRNDDLLTNADNLTMAPWGDLAIAEDSAGHDRIVGITPRGEQYLIVENVMDDEETAGVTFSPDGSTLFFNVQTPGLTVAVTGPWK